MVLCTYEQATQGNRSTPERAGYPSHFNHQAVLWYCERQSSNRAGDQSRRTADRRGACPVLPCSKQGTPHSSPCVKAGDSCNGLLNITNREDVVALLARYVPEESISEDLLDEIEERFGI